MHQEIWAALFFFRRKPMADGERMNACQAEIRRLRSVIQETMETAATIDYENLFEIWADFDDADAPGEVNRLIDHSGLGPVDAVSFNAFCYGFYRAMRKIKGTV
jgi:hypothetical protein